MRQTKKLTISLLMLAAVSLAACDYNPNDYSCFSAIDPSQGWEYGTTLVYIPEIEDSTANGTLTLMVRHNNDYPYSNLWLELSGLSREGQKLMCDTFCIELADVYGNWLGKGSGATFQRIDTLYRNFNLTDGAPLRLRHVMRADHVTGLEQVGLIFNANN